ncbi:ABC transporter ATP-binding protein [Xanthobacter sp. KR7-225]|uniref:ABC transporter ATP-binding protein n=1 Tax=Xanthobacter sp. KR7-225 TaxID=3156613 RepID=UPI0032B413A4
MEARTCAPARTPGAGSGEIAVSHASVGMYDRDGKPLRLVEDCSFRAERGLFTVLIGPSGCGKTTLMNLIAGYIGADRGAVKLDGVDVKGPGWDRLMVFQETALFPWMTTLENVAYGPMVRGIKTMPQIRAEAGALLERFGLGEFKNRYPRELSGGMQRRGELARALINDPLVLLMDEPFRGLDAMTRQLMQEYLTHLFEETRTTTIFVTSEIDEAIFLADRLVVLSRAPARVAAVIEVDLPRPRRFEQLSSARYAALKEEALNLLYAEAAAAFAETGAGADIKEAFEKRHAAD